MNLDDMMRPGPQSGQNSLQPYVGRPNPNDSILRHYRRLLNSMGQQEQTQGIENQLLNQLLKMNPQHRQSLLQMLYQKHRQGMDVELNNTLFGRGQANNNLRMNEMNYLPSGDWNRTTPELQVPLPRRM